MERFSGAPRAGATARAGFLANSVGPWALDKLQGLEKYLAAYTTALKNQPFTLIYIDAFAGAGYSKIRDGWTGASDDDALFPDQEFDRREGEYIKGSPSRALEYPFDHYHFFDFDEARSNLLHELKEEYPGRSVNIRSGDGNRLIQDLLPGVDGPLVRGVAFLDPYGPHLHWETLAVLGNSGKFEVIINFPLGTAINRLVTRSGDVPDGWRDSLNACFGGSDWENLVYEEKTDLFGDTSRNKVDDAAQRLLRLYCSGLEGLFGHVATPRVVRNTRGIPIYYMLWAGPHRLGLKIADHVLRRGERIA